MPGTITNPRVISQTAIGIEWQEAENVAIPAPPFTPRQFIVAQNLSRDPDPTYLRPNGTHGSIFQRYDGDRIISQAFKRELKMWGSRFQMLPFIESALSGKPTCPKADMNVTGVQAPNVSDLSFENIRPYHNTQKFSTSPAALPIVFGSIVGAGFPFTVDFYADSGMTDKVGSATVAAAATPTPIVGITPHRAPLSGSVTLGAGAAAGLFSAEIRKVTFVFGNTFERYFQMYYRDGKDVFVLADCAVSDLKLDSAENAELSVTASVMAKRFGRYADAVMTVPETELDLVSYSHSELTLTKNPLGVPVTPVLDSFSFEVKNNVLQYIANSATPQKLIKRGFVEITGSIRGEPCNETMAMVEDARANVAVGGGMITMRADYTLGIGLGTKTLRLDMPVKVRPKLKDPGIAAELVEKVELDFDVLYDGVTAPLAVTVEV